MASAGNHETESRIGDHMNEWLKPHIQETQAGMEVTSYLPAELDFA
jgi:coenzyme PQQ precursor peptide PqqA